MISFHFIILYAYFFLKCLSLGSNPAIIENELGSTLIACSTHCKDKDSLDLWLEVEWHCHNDDDTYGDGNGYEGMDQTSSIVQAPSRRRLKHKSRRLLNIVGEKTYVSRFFSGAICAIFTIFGICAGLYVGRNFRVSRFSYAAIPTDDYGSGGAGGKKIKS